MTATIRSRPPHWSHVIIAVVFSSVGGRAVSRYVSPIANVTSPRMCSKSARCRAAAKPKSRTFWKPQDYAAFERVLQDARGRVQMRVLAYPVPKDDHFLMVCRDVERNALRANLVQCAEDWLWRSHWHRLQRNEFAKAVLNDPSTE
jgi:hypothetical protein